MLAGGHCKSEPCDSGQSKDKTQRIDNIRKYY